MSKEYNNKIEKKGNKRGIRIFLKILLVLLIISVIFFAILTWYVHSKLSQINYVKLENIEMNEGVSDQLKGYRNIAIFGVDARANTYDNTRSDGIIIVSINQDTKDVKLVSIYRDTYVYIDGYGYDKITHAYAYGGPELAINTINKNLDLNISEFVAVNFDAVIEIVDAIGGVEMEISSAEVSEINKNIDSLLFLYEGIQVNFELSFKEQANSLDNINKQMKILVYQNKNEKDVNLNNKNLFENVPIFSQDDIRFNKATINETFKKWDVPSTTQIIGIILLEEDEKMESMTDSAIILLEAYEYTLSKSFSNNTAVIQKIEEYLENILEAKFDLRKLVE